MYGEICKYLWYWFLLTFLRFYGTFIKDIFQSTHFLNNRTILLFPHPFQQTRPLIVSMGTAVQMLLKYSYSDAAFVIAVTSAHAY